MERLYKKKPTRAELYVLLLYLSVFFTVGFLLVVRQPFHNARPELLAPPDEGDRFAVAEYIYEHGELPTGDEEEVQIPGYGGSYAYLPILPYIVMGNVMRAVSLFTEDVSALRIAARMVNLCFGTAMAFVVWLLGRRLFYRKTMLAVFCCGIMYLPQLLFLHTYVNTESMSLLSQALILYALVRMSQERTGVKNCLIFSAGAILCTLSYYNAYAYLLLSIPWFIYCCVEERDGKCRLDVKRMLKGGGLIVLCWCLGAGWWFLRNILLHGDMLGLESLKKAQESVLQFGLRAPTPMQQGMSVFTMISQPGFLQTVYHSFVANYGSMSILPPGWIYISFRWVYILLAVGLLLRCIMRIKAFCGRGGTEKKKKAANTFLREYAEKERPSYLPAPCRVMMLMICIVTAGLWIYYCYALDFQMQGRYLMPCVIPLYFWLAAGEEEWSLLLKNEKLKTGAALLVCAFWLLILFSYVFGVAMPLY